MKIMIIIIATVFIFMTTASIFVCKRRKTLEKERLKKGITSQMFFDYFLEKGVDQKLCKVVYEYFQEWMHYPVWPFGKKIESFPVMPQDDIGKIYEIYLETLDDAILEILARYQNIPVKNVDVTNIPEATIQTIDDLVMALWKQANSQPGKAKPAK